MVTTTNTYQLASGIILEVFENDGLMVNLDNEAIFSLNDTGVEIVRRIRDGLSIDATIAELASLYGIADTEIRAEVTQLVTTLVERQLIVEV